MDPISDTDLDGNPRIADGNGDGTAVIDRGAYERPAPTHPAAPLPSNAFSLGKLKRNKRSGTAKLQVQVPGPGALVLSGKSVKRATLAAGGAGAYSLAIVPKKKLARSLRSKGSAKTSIQVAFTPTGGTANSLAKPVKLIRGGRAQRLAVQPLPSRSLKERVTVSEPWIPPRSAVVSSARSFSV